MKRRKPCQHIRRIKTKHGIKRRVINNGIRRKRRMHTWEEYLKSQPSSNLRKMIQEDRPLSELDSIVSELRKRGEGPTESDAQGERDYEEDYYDRL